MANPTLLKTPIASGGDKNTIPETTGSTTGLLSQEKGWQQINSLPINAGGIAPSRLDFNGVFNLLSNILFYTQKGWQWEFDETQNYFAGCTVKDTVDGKTYVCVADVSASTTHPSSDTTHWKLSDLATKDDLANYLPLSGGTMMGSTLFRSGTTNMLTIGGGSSPANGSYITLQGKDCYGANDGGGITLDVIKDAQGNTMNLSLKGDGTCKWNGYNVLTDANGGFLPLAGGTMTGTSITRNSTSSNLILCGGADTGTGANLTLNGMNASGKAVIWARDTSSYCRIEFSPDGALRLMNQYIDNDLAGASIVAKSLGTTGYSKRADGLIEQWGTVTNLPASQSVVPVTFPITFPNGVGPVIITSAGDYGNQRGFSWGQVKDITTSGFNLSEASSDVDSQGKNWFAIGY